MFLGAWSNYPFFESGIVVVSDIGRGLFVLEPDLPDCSDGLDNDRDGLVDHPEDPGCESPDGAAELPRNDAWIDIRPRSAKNPILTFGFGVIPVALLGSPAYDVDQVDGKSLAFGPEAAPLAHRKCPHRMDVNGDGRPDLLAHFRTHEAGIAPGDLGGLPHGRVRRRHALRRLRRRARAARLRDRLRAGADRAAAARAAPPPAGRLALIRHSSIECGEAAGDGLRRMARPSRFVIAWPDSLG